MTLAPPEGYGEGKEEGVDKEEGDADEVLSHQGVLSAFFPVAGSSPKLSA